MRWAELSKMKTAEEADLLLFHAGLICLFSVVWEKERRERRAAHDF